MLLDKIGNRVMLFTTVLLILRNQCTQVVARHYATQLPLTINHRIEALHLVVWFRITAQRTRKVFERKCIREGHDVGAHHLTHEEDFERINGVLTSQMIATTTDLLGQDRAAHDKDSEAVRNHASDQQG